MVKNLFKKEILYIRLSQAAKAFAAAPSPCPKPWQAIKCHRGRGGGVPAFRCQTILDHFFHQFAGETSFPQLILSQKIEDCRGMWMQTIKNSHTYNIHVFRYLDQLTIHIYDWARFFKQAKTGFSWFPLLQLMFSSLHVEHRPRENQPEGTVLLKKCWQRNFTPKDFFLQIIDFTWLPRPPAGVHLVHWGAPEPCFLWEGWSLRCALEHHLVEIPH